MANELNREDVLYEQEFGNIPNDQLGRIAYILGKRVNNDKVNTDIQKTARKIKRMKTRKLEFTLWKIMKPSARPRANTRSGYVHMYVPHSNENKAWFEKYMEENELPHISTPCKFNIDIYEKTPSSFNMKEKVLAELGLLRPYHRTGDFDNYAKAVTDMCQAQNGLFLEDDCLIYESRIRRFYSIKPHTDVCIEYMEGNPFDLVKEKRK